MESLKARHAAGDNKSPYAEPLHIVFGKVGYFAYFERITTKQKGNESSEVSKKETVVVSGRYAKHFNYQHEIQIGKLTF